MPHSREDRERLILCRAAEVALRRRARGLRLNSAEAVAVLSAFLLEGARDGHSALDLIQSGRRVLRREDVMDGVPEALSEVAVEATFPDGRRLVTITTPIL